MRALFSRGDMRLLLAGQALSMFGDAAMWLALAIWAKALTGSNAAAGLVFFILALGRLLSPLTGLVVDRVRRRPLLVLVNAAMAGVVLLLLLVHDRGQLWLIYLVAFLYGAAAGVLASGRAGLLKTMLADDLLADANAAFATVREGLRLISPLVGAGLFAAAGGGAVAVVDAATFLLAAASLAALRVAEAPSRGYEHRLRTELLAGMRHVVATTALRQIVLAVAAALLVIGFAETVIFAVVDQGLGRPPSFVGVLEAFQGVGAIGGGLTAARTLRRLGDGRLAGAGIALFALGDGLFVFASPAPVLVGFTVAGAGVAWATVGFATALQVRTPLRLQGRVMSAADVMITIPQSLSIALGAALSTVVDYRVLVVVITGVTGLCAAYLLTRRGFARALGEVVATGS